jgi:hypothetical protein
MSLSAFELGVHGAACGLFLLLAGLTWRDRRQTRSGPLGVALMLGAAASSVNSVPVARARVGAGRRQPCRVLAVG